MNKGKLKKELPEFLTPLSDGSPAKYNRPYSNLNTFINWFVYQGVMSENILISIGLKKKRDDGRICFIEADKIKSLSNVINLKT